MIELEGEWEVGLAEMSVPSRVENVVKGRCYFDLYIDNERQRTMTIRPKHYKRITDVTDNLASLQTGRHIPKSPVASFSYDREIKRIRVQLVLLDLTNSVPGIQFSPDFAILLGFDSHVIYSGHLLTAERSINLRDNIYSTYVYCDLVEHVSVGDTKAPLLRIVDKPKRVGGNLHQVGT